MTPLLTTPKEFENAALFLRLSLSVTKTEVFENLLQTGGIENAALFRRFGLSVTKTEVIENLLQTGGIENAALFRRSFCHENGAFRKALFTPEVFKNGRQFAF